MSARSRFLPANRWLEPAFAALILAGLLFAMGHLWRYGYLPQPFFYQPFDMWADWFNVVYWSYDPGTYDVYRSIYPPLSFVFMRVFSIAQCYPVGAAATDMAAGLPARGCDWVGVLTFHAIFAIDAACIALSYVRQDRRTAPWRAFALAAGLPALEAIEHANLIMVALLLVILAYGPLLKSARLRWLAAGLAINFKVYIVSTVFAQLLLRRWRWTESALIVAAIVYLLTYAILGRGTPIDIYRNIVQFAAASGSTLLDAWFPATYIPIEAQLDDWRSPLVGMLGSRTVDILRVLLPLLQHTTQAMIGLAATAVWLRPEAVTRYRVTGLAISMALLTSESGGYALVLPLFFTFMERWRGAGAKWAIVAAYILCIPLDIPIEGAADVVRHTFFSGRTVIISYDVMIGPAIRPLFFYSIPFALSCATIRQVWADIHAQGWKTRWRYRHDQPIMAGEGAARPPLGAPPAG